MSRIPTSATDAATEMDPPSYEESTSRDGEKVALWETDSKASHVLSIREEVGASRSQHVAALISKLLPHVRERARRGLSKFSFLILPSDQAEISKKGDLVGFPVDDRPVLEHLEGEYDNTQFWTQQEALDLLQQQMFEAVAGDVPRPVIEDSLPARPEPQSRSSWFRGRKQSKGAEVKAVAVASRSPVKINVELETINFRTVTEFGLYETIRGRAVLLVVHVAK